MPLFTFLIEVSMLKLIAYSEKDVAGSNIAKLLEEKMDGLKGVRLQAYPDSLLYVTETPDDAGLLIVASRHRSESGMPTLTCHVTGNFGRAELGGEDMSLAFAPALHLRKALMSLQEHGMGLDYTVSLEVTHHGPTSLRCPLIFVEVGSCEKQWNDMIACEAAAKTIHDLVAEEPEETAVAIGFGGPHYAPNFSKIMEKVAFGHIMAKYSIGSLSKTMVEQMMEKTIPKPELAVLDWKGLKGEEKKQVVGILEEIGVEWKKTSDY
ncbi:MAG: D-aminoacyl-tRNA deacylase [Candidatus Altiarchaeota archaeon]